MAGIFNRSIFNRAIFNTDDSGLEFGGHFVDFKKYRRRLERLSKIYDERDNRRYIKNITDVVEISNNLDIPTDEIRLAEAALQQGFIPQIDYDEFAKEINRLILYIDDAITQIIREIESDDMMALLLLV